MKILAVIPARAGSKGIKNKNIAALRGRPLIAWTIQAARLVPDIDRIIVSTDSERIADIARRYGAEVPFMRPKELGRDDTPGMAPILHAIRWLSHHEEYRPDSVMVLQPTSPLRTAGDIKGALAVFAKRRADAVVSVAEANEHPYLMRAIDGRGRLKDFIKNKKGFEFRQRLPRVYVINGAIYIAKTEVLKARKDWYTDRTFPYIMPGDRSIDIDAPGDMDLAERYLDSKKKI